MFTWSESPRCPFVTALCAVVGLMPFVFGCQWTDADEVNRLPNSARGTGGSRGQDLGDISDASSDGQADVLALRDSAVADTTLTGAPDRYDGVRDSVLLDSASLDGEKSAIDLGQAADLSLPEVEE